MLLLHTYFDLHSLKKNDNFTNFFFRVYFHDFILQKIREKPSDRIWIKDVSNGRYEIFGNIPGNVTKIASGLTRLGFGKGKVALKLEEK